MPERMPADDLARYPRTGHHRQHHWTDSAEDGRYWGANRAGPVDCYRFIQSPHPGTRRCAAVLPSSLNRQATRRTPKHHDDYEGQSRAAWRMCEAS